MGKLSELLDRAADIIERSGWTQHTARDGAGHVCLNHAISMAALADAGNYVRAFDALRIATRTLSPAIWNDVPGRTKEEVIAVLRATALNVRAAETSADDIKYFERKLEPEKARMLAELEVIRQRQVYGR